MASCVERECPMDITNSGGNHSRPKETDPLTPGAGLSNTQVMEIFETSFNQLRDYLLPIVGPVALGAIFRNAVRENKAKFPFLMDVTTGDTEISPDTTNLKNIPSEELLQGFFAFLQSIIGLLTELTGDVLAGKAKTLLSAVANQLGEDHHG